MNPMPEFYFSLERLEKALQSGTITLPRGLGRGRQQFVRDNNQRLTQPSVDRYHAAECVRGLILG